MAYYILTKYRSALKQEGVDAESAYSELDSVLSRVYLMGFMSGTAIGMPFLYSTTPDRQWPIYISITGSAAVTGIAFKTWLEFEKFARSEVEAKTLQTNPLPAK